MCEDRDTQERQHLLVHVLSICGSALAALSISMQSIVCDKVESKPNLHFFFCYNV
jgi:hypothetical protein